MALSKMIPVYVLIALATPAGAQPASTQADQLFYKGRSLMTAGKVAEACAAFEQSQKLDPAVSTLINLAACREKLGQLASAWRLLRVAELQTQAANDDVTAQLRKIVLERVGKLEPRVPKLTIRVPDQDRSNRLEILLNGERIANERWNRAILIDGGAYTIIARVPGGIEWWVSVTLAPWLDAQTVDVPSLEEPRPRSVTPNRSGKTGRR
jgi:tetratricopeptide (TPR) repeat protein